MAVGDGGERRHERKRDARRESVLLVSTSSETEENLEESHNTVPIGEQSEEVVGQSTSDISTPSPYRLVLITVCH